jgi:hypothetical protein
MRTTCLPGLRAALVWGASWMLVACSAVKADRAAPPPEPVRSDLIFSHALHQEQGAECETCHEGVAESKDLRRRHSPTKATCAECHEVKDKQECGKCHPDPKRASKLTRAPSSSRMNFSHASHAKRAKDCKVCHATAVVATSLAEVPRPKMRGDCFSCHNHLKEYRRASCKRCHQSLNRFPIKYVSSFNHQGNFLKEHSRWARASADLCATCHDQGYCADCHSSRAGMLASRKQADRSGRRFIHRGAWISRHAAASRADPGSCTRCHSSKTCASCHRSRGISASRLATSKATRSPHPPSWLTPGSPNSHGRSARRRITQCASCHDRGSLTNCIRCHKSVARGGLGLRPHPPGWERGGKTSDKVCLYCH